MSKPKDDKIADLQPEIILELLTSSEIRMLKQRVVIIKLIHRGLSVRAISKEIGVGTDTVMRITRKLESSPKLRKLFGKEKEKKSTSSKWVFGQVSVEKE